MTIFRFWCALSACVVMTFVGVTSTDGGHDPMRSTSIEKLLQQEGDLIPNTFAISKAKAAAERAASLLNVIAASSSFLGAVCTTTRSTFCATSAFLASGATWTLSGMAAQTAIELGDPDFQKVEVPDGGLSDNLKTSLRHKPLVSTILNTVGVLNALYRTANRFTGAARAESVQWIAIQSNALQRYEAEADKNIRNLEPNFVLEVKALIQSVDVHSSEDLKRLIERQGAEGAVQLERFGPKLDAVKLRIALWCLSLNDEDRISTASKLACREVFKLSFSR